MSSPHTSPTLPVPQGGDRSGGPPSGQDWVGAPSGTGGGGTPPVAPGRTGGRSARRRGPGWSGLVVVALATSLVSAGLVGGVLTATAPTAPAPVLTSPSGSAAGAQPAANVPFNRSVDWKTLADRVRPSVVTIKVVNGQGEGGEGTGVVLDKEGHVLTNDHVATAAGPGGRIQVALSDGRLYRAKAVGTDPSTDLAVLQLSKPPSDLVPATFGRSSTVVVGQQVMAVGNPLGLSDTVTTGIVSATNRPVTTQAEAQPQQPRQQDPFGLPGAQGGQPAGPAPVITNALQTDAAINPGNSGGPLVDASGLVIGINSSIASPSQGAGQAGSVGLGFAIPSDEAKRISTELVADGKATHAQLGVSLGQDADATADGTTRRAATISAVVDGSPAATAGLRAGDQVVAIDGVATPGSDSLVAIVHEHAPGDTVTLGVVRGGKVQEVVATLQEQRVR